MNTVLTKAAFARLIGRDRSWVTRMAQAQRLVMEGHGRHARVRVAESQALLAQTAGLRDDVAARHAEARSKAAIPAPIAAPPAPEAPPAGDPAANGLPAFVLNEMDEARRAKLLAESRRVQAAADREEMERDKLAGDLIAREDVDAAMKFIGASVRGLMEVFPDQIAPVVAPITTLDDVHAALTEACRDTLVRLGEAIERQKDALARGGA